jgi:hypothetical protein
MKRPGRPGSSDRGPPRGVGGSGRRRPDPESESDESSDASDESDEEESSEEEVPVKKGSGKTSARGAASAKSDSARKRRSSSASNASPGRGGPPPDQGGDTIKKAMLIAIPVLLVFVIVMAVIVANQSTPEKAKDIVIDYNTDIEQAKKLRGEAMDFYKQAEGMSDNDSKKAPLLAAEKKLREAAELINKVRENTPPPKEGMEDPFEADATKINESLKVVRTAIMESGAR